MYVIFSLLLVVAVVTLYILNGEKFGSSPTCERMVRISRSAHYSDGSFQNLNPTPVMSEDANYFAVFRDALFGRSKRNRPHDKLPAQKNDLKKLNPEENLLVWFGHSSYLMQIDGKKILVDPVFSGNASPFSFAVKSFDGTDVYTTDDMPDIDYLVISHDHWDHLDFETVDKLKPRISKVITGLGTGAHFERWGFAPEQIVELDWSESVSPDSGFVFTATPARHFSGRGFRRNQAIWSSFVLQTPSKKIFIGGDSGYDTHFAKIGAEHGPFDLALLECGQYNQYWKYIHNMPWQTVQEAIELKAKKLMPVHWAKFALAYHAWDEPIEQVVKEAGRLSVPIIHPMIGAIVNLDEMGDTPEWWKGID